mmetsp:Transcript_74078/g.176667  ORF Transcript_74078/g.176667 Transcript_74078/m.176667 type:complete len:311 (+) Transcript_74078:1470-2402(+)
MLASPTGTMAGLTRRRAGAATMRTGAAQEAGTATGTHMQSSTWSTVSTSATAAMTALLASPTGSRAGLPTRRTSAVSTTTTSSVCSTTATARMRVICTPGPRTRATSAAATSSWAARQRLCPLWAARRPARCTARPALARSASSGRRKTRSPERATPATSPTARSRWNATCAARAASRRPAAGCRAPAPSPSTAKPPWATGAAPGRPTRRSGAATVRNWAARRWMPRPIAMLAQAWCGRKSSLTGTGPGRPPVLVVLWSSASPMPATKACRTGTLAGRPPRSPGAVPMRIWAAPALSTTALVRVAPPTWW